jgi:hypothetical protein
MPHFAKRCFNYNVFTKDGIAMDDYVKIVNELKQKLATIGYRMLMQLIFNGLLTIMKAFKF